jgi:hypothetical protein
MLLLTDCVADACGSLLEAVIGLDFIGLPTCGERNDPSFQKKSAMAN